MHQHHLAIVLMQLQLDKHMLLLVRAGCCFLLDHCLINVTEGFCSYLRLLIAGQQALHEPSFELWRLPALLWCTAPCVHAGFAGAQICAKITSQFVDLQLLTGKREDAY